MGTSVSFCFILYIVLYIDIYPLSQPAADALLEHNPPHPVTSEGDGQTDMDELSHTIQDLESQVVTLHRAESLALESVVTLEDELKNMRTLEDVGALAFLPLLPERSARLMQLGLFVCLYVCFFVCPCG